MTDLQTAPDLLRVASPYACNTQQRGDSAQQSAQQAVALPSLKALAVTALARNNPSNSAATTAEVVCNNASNPEGPVLHAIRSRLLTLAAAERIDAAHVQVQDDDLTECRGLSDDTLRDWLRLREFGRMIDRGIPPPGYSKAVACSGCGPVLLWPTCPNRVTACPWCFRRKAGKAIPRPPY